MSAIPPDFTIPEELVPAVAAIRDRYSLTAAAISDDLHALGLPRDQAITVAVDMLIEWACAAAMLNALILHDREPQLERWQAVTTEKFELTAKRLSPLFAGLGRVL